MPKLNSMFKKTTYITLSNRQQSIRQDALVTEKELEQPNVPEGLWKKCEKCGALLYDRDLEKISMCVRMWSSSAHFCLETDCTDC